MIEIPQTTEAHAASPAITAVRAQLMAGLCDVETFAAALNKTKRQVQTWIHNGMPCVHYGRDPYVIIDLAKEWLIAQKTAA